MELFEYLAVKVADVRTENSHHHQRHRRNHQEINIRGIAPYSHEEADTRIFLHASHAAKEGIKAVIVKANDRDVLVIAIGTFPQLQELGLQKMWLAFAQGRHLKWLLLTLFTEKISGMLFFHPFTGCDVVSAFQGKG